MTESADALARSIVHGLLAQFVNDPFPLITYTRPALVRPVGSACWAPIARSATPAEARAEVGANPDAPMTRSGRPSPSTSPPVATLPAPGAESNWPMRYPVIVTSAWVARSSMHGDVRHEAHEARPNRM